MFLFGLISLTKLNCLVKSNVCEQGENEGQFVSCLTKNNVKICNILGKNVYK